MISAELPDEPTGNKHAHDELAGLDLTAAESAEPAALSRPDADGDRVPNEPSVAAFQPPQVYRPLAFIEVRLDLPNQYPTVVLQEFDSPHRQVVIPIGMAEGNAIAYAAKQIPTSRPLTHALMIAILEEFGLDVLTLRITGVESGNYSAELVVSGPEGQRTIACRVSDGIALCLRQRPPVPITALPSVIDQAGSPA